MLLRNLYFYIPNLPASPRATWRKMERSCLRTEIRSSCKHLSKVSDDRQGYLQSVEGFKVLNSINPPHLILVGRDQPLKRVSDHRKRDWSRGESRNVWFQRCQQLIRLFFPRQEPKFFLLCFGLQTKEMLMPCCWCHLTIFFHFHFHFL